jgi:hypothetical protein
MRMLISYIGEHSNTAPAERPKHHRHTKHGLVVRYQMICSSSQGNKRSASLWINWHRGGVGWPWHFWMKYQCLRKHVQNNNPVYTWHIYCWQRNVMMEQFWQRHLYWNIKLIMITYHYTGICYSSSWVAIFLLEGNIFYMLPLWKKTFLK